MADLALMTVSMTGYLDDWRNRGDKAAADALFLLIGDRMEKLARKMLRAYPVLDPFVDTCDVVSGATCRLLTALKKIEPVDTSAFFGLAARQIRWELLDLVRQYKGKAAALGGDPDSELAPAAPDSRPDELELWGRFHAAVDQLDGEMREVFSLTFYHGWTQAQIAELLGMSDKTVRSRYRAALARITRLVGELPEL